MSKRAIVERITSIVICSVYVFGMLTARAGAISKQDLSDVLNGHPYYSATAEDSLLCGSPSVVAPNGLKSGTKIYMIGDSISVQSMNELNAAYAGAGYIVTKINADSGRAISSDTAGNDPTGLDAVAADAGLIASSDAVVVELGTNSGTEDLNTQIPALINAIRSAPGKDKIPIYWVNLFYTASGGPAARNETIKKMSTAPDTPYSIIDTTKANIPLVDQIHPTVEGRGILATTIRTQLASTISEIAADGNAFHILTYPPISDEVAAAQAIDNYIKSGWPTSPFVGLGKDFISGGKQYNVNPFLAVGHLERENGFATATSGWHTTTPPSYNAFGRSASESQPHTVYHGKTKDRLVYAWPSWEASLIASDSWFEYIHRNYLSAGSPYESHTFETYISHYAPNSDGNNETAYIAGLYKTIDALSGNVGGTTTTLNGSCGGSPATGIAAQYIPDCSVNDGNAAIACTAINELTGIPYSLAQRAVATDPDPKFLDCSALTGMAVYRTYGVDLGGLCSIGYKTDKNFQEIDVHDIKPGDLVGIGTSCTSSGGSGHIGVVVSYDVASKKLVTVEASSPKYLSGIRGAGGTNSFNVGLKADGNGNYEWAVRYIGPKTGGAD